MPLLLVSLQRNVFDRTTVERIVICQIRFSLGPLTACCILLDANVSADPANPLTAPTQWHGSPVRQLGSTLRLKVHPTTLYLHASVLQLMSLIDQYLQTKPVERSTSFSMSSNFLMRWMYILVYEKFNLILAPRMLVFCASLRLQPDQRPVHH